MSRAITGGREDAMRKIGKLKRKASTRKKVTGLKTRVRSTRGVRNINNRNKGAKPRKRK
jgi:hypothetical protein